MSALPCAVEHDLRDYERQVDRDAELDMAIEKRAADLQLPGADCYPFDVLNYGEAVSEVFADSFGPVVAQMAKLQADGDDLEAATVLRAAVVAYWSKQAEAKAEQDVPNEKPEYDPPYDCDDLPYFLRQQATAY